MTGHHHNTGAVLSIPLMATTASAKSQVFEWFKDSLKGARLSGPSNKSVYQLPPAEARQARPFHFSLVKTICASISGSKAGRQWFANLKMILFKLYSYFIELPFDVNDPKTPKNWPQKNPPHTQPITRPQVACSFLFLCKSGIE